LEGVIVRDSEEVEMDTSDPTYERDIRPLFRGKDIESMSSQFDLSAYGDVRENADRILQTLSDGSMPCDGPWPPERVALFREWVDAGCPP
jgi:hypothetical protein